MHQAINYIVNRCHATELFAHEMWDKQIHYGLVFTLPATLDRSDVRRCSDLNTRSRHGEVGDWWLGAAVPDLPTDQAVLLIPRTWLIRQGFLPWWVLFLPYHTFGLRHADALAQHVWLEWSEPPAGAETSDYCADQCGLAQAA